MAVGAGVVVAVGVAMTIIDEQVNGRIIQLTRCSRCDGDAILKYGAVHGEHVLCRFCTRRERTAHGTAKPN